MDFLISGLCGAIINLIINRLPRMNMFHFFISIMGGVICTALARAFKIADANIVTSASFMLLLLGLSFVSSIRDIVNGDLVSGISRLGEVFIIAFSVALGSIIVTAF